jgi:transcriptional regulator with XRE-family HTH domain
MNIDIEKLRADATAVKGRFPELAAKSGLSYSWLCKFAAGRQLNPTMTSVEKLSAALAQMSAAPESKAA